MIKTVMVKKLVDIEVVFPGFTEVWRAIKADTGTRCRAPKSVTFTDEPRSMCLDDDQLGKRYPLDLVTMKLGPGLRVSARLLEECRPELRRGGSRGAGERRPAELLLERLPPILLGRGPGEEASGGPRGLTGLRGSCERRTLPASTAKSRDPRSLERTGAMDEEIEVKGACRGSYAWSVANGRAFEVVAEDSGSSFGTYYGVEITSAEIALRCARSRYPSIDGRRVEIRRHMPGSRIGCTIVEKVLEATA